MARFKYLREEFALDALVDYGTEPAYAGRDVPNPERQRLNAEIRQAHTHLEQLQAHYGLAALENRERLRPTMRGFKIANAALSARLREAMRRITALETQRATVPARVPVQEVVAADVVKLSVERKHLTDLLKMLAYQAEGDLGSSSPPTPPHRAGGPHPHPDRPRRRLPRAQCRRHPLPRHPAPDARFTLKPEPPRSLAFPGARNPSGGDQPDILVKG